VAKEQSLLKVEQDIAAGNLGRARDRLHGLIAYEPNNLALRGALAAVYAQLRFPAMAGRYWYLEEEKTDAMQAAAAEFERSHGHDPLRILLALKFKGDIDELDSPYARSRLLALEEQCERKYHYYPNRQGAGGQPGEGKYVRTADLKGTVLGVGCALTAVAVVVAGVVKLLEILKAIVLG
jgi:hypothetical protein